MTDITQFTPSPGYILLEDVIEKDSIVKSNIKKDDDGPQTRVAKVVAVGEDYINDFGTPRKALCRPGDTVSYRHVYGCDELEFNYLKYPIVGFEMIRGVIK